MREVIEFIKNNYNGEVINFIESTKEATYKCENSHIFTKKYQTSVRRDWCVKCYANTFYNKIKEYVEQKGGKCLFDEYMGNSSPITIQCGNKHTFSTTYCRVMSVKQWCSICSGTRLSLLDAQNVATDRGGQCLDTEYKNTSSKMTWKCYRGHIWKASLDHVKNAGSWCSKCNISVAEEITRNIFDLLFDDKFIKCRPVWLNGLEFDGYCEQRKIAFEYDGMQHYQFVKYFHKTEENFQIAKERDILKNQLCSELNVKLIRIPYTVKFDNIKTFVVTECDNQKIIVPNKNIDIDYRQFIDIYTQNDNTYKDIKNIVEENGGVLLSPAYVSLKSNMEVKCKYGHVFEIRTSELKKGSWCVECNQSIRRDSKYDDIKKIVEEKGGLLIGSVYITSRSKIIVKCKHDHNFDIEPYDLKNGMWCNECKNSSKNNSKYNDIKKIVEEKGGILISSTYVSNHSKMKFLCKYNHECNISHKILKKGGWCGECYRLRIK